MHILSAYVYLSQMVNRPIRLTIHDPEIVFFLQPNSTADTPYGVCIMCVRSDITWQCGNTITFVNFSAKYTQLFEIKKRK